MEKGVQEGVQESKRERKDDDRIESSAYSHLGETAHNFFKRSRGVLHQRLPYVRVRGVERTQHNLHRAWQRRQQRDWVPFDDGHQHSNSRDCLQSPSYQS